MPDYMTNDIKTTPEKKKSRILWMDMLNIVSCVSVVILHTTNTSVHWWNGVTDMEYLWGMLTHTLCICAVPLFLMLSGANLLPQEIGYKEFFIRRFLRVGIPFLFWSLVYWLIFYPTINIKQFWELFFKGQMNPHMWFFIPLFSLYLSTPFLHIFIKHASKRDVEYLLLFSFVLTSFTPFLYGSLSWFFPGYLFPLAGQLLFMGVLGYYLNTYEVKWRNKQILGCYALAFIFHFGYLIIKTQILGHSDELILRYESPSIAIMSACLFILFKRTSWSMKEKHTSIVTRFASCSFGVYLTHFLIITFLTEFAPSLQNVYYGFIIVYFISLLFTILIKKVPLLRKCV